MRKGTLFWLVAGTLIALDQYTKLLAYDLLRPIGAHPLLDGLIGLRYVENTGAAFSMLEGQQLLLSLLSAVIALLLLGLAWNARRRKLPVALHITYAVLFAGAVGNLIDRFARGYVIDFLEFRFISFPVFNIADICVTVGAVILGSLHLLWKMDLY